MNTKPILFQGDMVRAILEGRKTQTRRIVKPQPEYRENRAISGHYGTFFHGWNLDHSNVSAFCYSDHCPYGQPGDLLWVRETFCDSRKAGRVRYKATDGEALKYESYKPSIHMPRWASRLTLQVTDVRVERVQDISDSDALAEGICPKDVAARGWVDARVGFRGLWRSINGAESWQSNPWVWVVEFRPIEANVDDVLKQRGAK